MHDAGETISFQGGRIIRYGSQVTPGLEFRIYDGARPREIGAVLVPLLAGTFLESPTPVSWGAEGLTGGTVVSRLSMIKIPGAFAETNEPQAVPLSELNLLPIIAPDNKVHVRPKSPFSSRYCVIRHRSKEVTA